jgi:anthranilate synthase component 1
MPADFETPASVYLKLADERPSFLLESVTGGEQLARYSFIGVGLEEAFILDKHKIKHHTPGGSIEEYSIEKGRDVFEVLRTFLERYKTNRTHELPRFSGGLVGFWGYNAISYFEPTVKTGQTGQIPEAIFLVTNALVAFDHAFGRILLIANVDQTNDQKNELERANAQLDVLEERLMQPIPRQEKNGNHFREMPFKSNVEQATFEEAVRKAKEHIAAGDIFQVVLSQRLSRQTDAKPFDIYRALRRLNPSPYMVFFNFGTLGSSEQPLHIIGASPEMHVRLEDDLAVLRPIAGTRQRGRAPAEDFELEEELLADPKERAEHIMLVDLGRNDLGRVCEFGSIDVKDFMVIERYSHVMHIVSQVEGKLKEGLDSFDLLAATFPAGTVSGAPKIRAMQIIEELEWSSRGPYAGVIGYFSYDGSMDSCIAIRTITMQGNLVSVHAGAGIVADSDPEKEYEETMNKARALAEAVVMAEGSETP